MNGASGKSGHRGRSRTFNGGGWQIYSKKESFPLGQGLADAVVHPIDTILHSAVNWQLCTVKNGHKKRMLVNEAGSHTTDRTVRRTHDGKFGAR